MRTISLRLDSESDALLRTLCERLGATQTDVIRTALDLLSKNVMPTPGSLGIELGLVGMFAGGGRGDGAGHSAAVKARLAERRRDERPAAPDAAAKSVKQPAKSSKRGPRASKR